VTGAVDWPAFPILRAGNLTPLRRIGGHDENCTETALCGRTGCAARTGVDIASGGVAAGAEWPSACRHWCGFAANSQPSSAAGVFTGAGSTTGAGGLGVAGAGAATSTLASGSSGTITADFPSINCGGGA